jgi:ABC-type transport system involved in cytochrome c biogenesis permease subunit
MALKASLLGALVYAALAAYGSSAISYAAGRRRAGRILSGLAFALLFAAVCSRALEVGRVPLQNLFEVFLCLGMLVWPVSLLCGRLLGVAEGGADAALGFLLLFPAAFFLDATPTPLPPILQSRLFGPHVGAYLLGYFVMFKAAVQSMRALWMTDGTAEPACVAAEAAAFRLVRAGFPLLTVGLVLGSVWGKSAWGDYWNWDPKELWGAAMWLVYLSYFEFRVLTRARYPRANSILCLLGACVIAVTVSWVNLSRLFSGLHSYAT